MEYIAKCLERFRRLPEGIKKEFGGVEALKIVKTIENQYGINTSFLVILVAIGELVVDDVTAYLEAKFKLSEENAYEINEMLLRGIFARIFRTTIGSEFDKKKLKEFLQEKLDLILKDNDEAEAFNYNAFLILSVDGSFVSELEKAIVNSPVEIGFQRLEKDQKKMAPTVANWLKDFISINGSDNFNDLVIINYLSNSKNARSLPESDKKLLFKVLKTYRNTAFFLENAEKLPTNLLEIVPTEREENTLAEGIKNKASNKPGMVNVLDDSTDINNSVEPPVFKTAKPEAIPATKSVLDDVSSASNLSSSDEDMQTALANYQPDSLEYKAIKQEFKRLSQKTKAKG